MTALNHTHDPAARSWVASANTPGTYFPIQNLPLAVFRYECTAEGDGRFTFLSKVAETLLGVSVHDLQANGQPAWRVVLGAWHSEGSMVKVTPDDVELIHFPF